MTTSQELNATTTRSRLSEIETRYQANDTENSQLRRDKVLLVDHVSDLQKQVLTSQLLYYIILSIKIFHIGGGLVAKSFAYQVQIPVGA